MRYEKRRQHLSVILNIPVKVSLKLISNIKTTGISIRIVGLISKPEGKEMTFLCE